MAILKGIARQDTDVGRVSEGADVNLRATRDGALFTADWKLAMIMEGRGFMFNVGTGNAAATGGGSAGTVIDIDAPEFIVRVPNGTSIMPLMIEISTTLPVGATNADEVDILLAVDQDSMQTDGTFGTQPTIYNMNSLKSRGSNCTVDMECEAAMTTPVNDLELAHMNKVFAIHNTDAELLGSQWTELKLHYEPETLVVINGPAMLLGYFGGTAITKAIAVVQWLELPEDMV